MSEILAGQKCRLQKPVKNLNNVYFSPVIVPRMGEIWTILSNKSAVLTDDEKRTENADKVTITLDGKYKADVKLAAFDKYFEIISDNSNSIRIGNKIISVGDIFGLRKEPDGLFPTRIGETFEIVEVVEDGTIGVKPFMPRKTYMTFADLFENFKKI